MLMNMPTRTTVMVERRMCHQVTSRVTSSDLAKVLYKFSSYLNLPILAIRFAIPFLFKSNTRAIVASPHLHSFLLKPLIIIRVRL